MISALELRERRNARPFKPFRICMSDGKTYDTPSHDMFLVKLNAVEIGVELDAKGFAIRTASCAIDRIARIEEIPSTNAA
jgi:hypothetical protein